LVWLNYRALWAQLKLGILNDAKHCVKQLPNPVLKIKTITISMGCKNLGFPNKNAKNVIPSLLKLTEIIESIAGQNSLEALQHSHRTGLRVPD